MDRTHVPIQELAKFSTCILCDALEKFDIRMRNHGYTRPGLRSMNGSFPTAVGFAVTARVRSCDPPTLGTSYVFDSTWMPAVAAAPKPAIVVIEDVDPHPGAGSCCGQTSAAMFHMLGCVAVVTNGAVRDLAEAAEIGIPLLSAFVAPSHSYAHLVDHSQRVAIQGLVIASGDLLAADCHGVVAIPLEIAAELPRVAAEVQQRKRRFVDLCKTGNAPVEQLFEEVKQLRP